VLLDSALRINVRGLSLSADGVLTANLRTQWGVQIQTKKC
jgi:hypothetical protein